MAAAPPQSSFLSLLNAYLACEATHATTVETLATQLCASASPAKVSRSPLYEADVSLETVPCPKYLSAEFTPVKTVPAPASKLQKKPVPHESKKMVNKHFVKAQERRRNPMTEPKQTHKPVSKNALMKTPKRNLNKENVWALATKTAMTGKKVERGSSAAANKQSLVRNATKEDHGWKRKPLCGIQTSSFNAAKRFKAF